MEELFILLDAIGAELAEASAEAASAPDLSEYTMLSNLSSESAIASAQAGLNALAQVIANVSNGVMEASNSIGGIDAEINMLGDQISPEYLAQVRNYMEQIGGSIGGLQQWATGAIGEEQTVGNAILEAEQYISDLRNLVWEAAAIAEEISGIDFAQIAYDGFDAIMELWDYIVFLYDRLQYLYGVWSSVPPSMTGGIDLGSIMDSLTNLVNQLYSYFGY